MISKGIIILGALGLGGIALASSKKKSSGRTDGCKLTSAQAILLANQAALSKDPGLVYGTAAIFDGYGCPAEAKALRDFYNPPKGTSFNPVGGDKVDLKYGMGFRAAAILGPIGCAVPISTIHDKLVAEGFMGDVFKGPMWGWKVPDGMLECVRSFDVVYTGEPKTMTVPKQVWRAERVS